ncbi:MAG: hypothetical protein RBR15_04420 [Sphaerochaeta sp.]|nr:hypothetical protein [Sphaerochaeta sp.]
MQRKHVLAYLLFSLFLFSLLVSCFSPSSEQLSKLATEGKYRELEGRTASMLAKRIEAEPLFYKAIALEGQKRGVDAFHVLNLYFAMAEKESRYLVEAHRMMTSLALEAGRPQQCIASALWLEELSLLGQVQAKAYYQGLLAVGGIGEAARVFSQYLKESISSYAYAEMLLGSFSVASPPSSSSSYSQWEELEQVFSTLSLEERLTLLQKAASVTVPGERATLLLSLATPLEQAFEGTQTLKQVYTLLETLYGYADLRVQGRKYSTLANNF